MTREKIALEAHRLANVAMYVGLHDTNNPRAAYVRALGFIGDLLPSAMATGNPVCVAVTAEAAKVVERNFAAWRSRAGN